MAGMKVQIRSPEAMAVMGESFMKVVGMVRTIALDTVEPIHLTNGENHGYPELVW